MMANWLDLLITLALGVMVILLLPAFWRVWHSETTADRLLGVDLITTLLIGILALLALVEESAIYLDMGLVLAALSFVGTISIARYLSEGRVI